MTLLRFKELGKLAKKDLDAKLKDLRMELIKANVAANKTNSKTKEIKKAISRIITFNKQQDLLKKK